jgi:delta 1-pyrroline-5-carboxylate dehydrogenase
MSNWSKLGAAERAQTLLKVSDDVALQDFITGAAKRISEPLILPGPTGELNRLSLEPRGLFVCLDANKDANRDNASKENGGGLTFLFHIYAALLAGNSVTLIGMRAELYHKKLIKLGLEESVISLTPQSQLNASLARTDLAGVSFNGVSEQARELGRTLAGRDGVIVPLIWNAPLTPALILRFMTEKTVTINTAAIGGNAALLGLGSE